jgi:RimJ/RimL family protein N-acetyltransferase
MKFSNKYSCLNKNEFSLDQFKIIPLRYEDRLEIMKWRNEQIYHLRQNKPLTIKDQEKYFTTVIPYLFKQKQPDQLLFSFLENNNCIGYGGLVRINWLDKNAEISFIMNTELEEKKFELNWLRYLNLIEDLGFNELKLKKIYIYAFDLRPYLYKVLEKGSYFLDARLKSHCIFNNEYKDVVIYSKIK